VRDHDRGAAVQQRAQGGLDVLFGDGVEVGGGLVEDDDPWVAQDDSFSLMRRRFGRA
jgi:hypothetical protein